MDKEEFVELLQSDKEELKKYMDRAAWHCKKVQELDMENQRLKAILGHLKVFKVFIGELLKNEEV